MTLKYQITVIESERGWGRDEWVEKYDTYELAKQRIESINSENTSLQAPDWYMVAFNEVTVIEE